MQVVLSATSSRPYRVLGDFFMSTDTLVLNSFMVSTLVPLASNLPMKHTYGVVKGAEHSLPLQLGFKRFQRISWNQGCGVARSR